MDSINPLISGHHPAATNLKKEQKKKTEKSAKGAFTGILKKSAAEESDSLQAASLDSADLETLVDDIFKLGEEVKKEADLNSMSAYRKAVGAFLKKIVSQSYQLERNKGIMNPRTFKQKEFVNVEVINKKLDSLAAYVLSSQKQQLEILKKVDEINGLIVNYLG